MAMPRLASCTDCGTRRRNEDSLRHGNGVNGWYALLADGAGGHLHGAEASSLAVQAMERVLLDPGVAFSPHNLTQMVRLAHAELGHQQGAARAEARMHTTIVALWIAPPRSHALWTHVGDSRLYRVRQGRLELLTEDDSVVQQMLKAGLITEEQSRTHPQKGHLMAALGMAGEVQPHTVVRPVELQEGDAFLLCTDGWWEGLAPADITGTLARVLTPADWLGDMHAHITARANPRQDNFSAIAVWIGDPAEVTVARSDDTVPRAASPGA